MADLREIQKIEYLQSLLADQMKDLLQERSAGYLSPNDFQTKYPLGKSIYIREEKSIRESGDYIVKIEPGLESGLTELNFYSMIDHPNVAKIVNWTYLDKKFHLVIRKGIPIEDALLEGKITLDQIARQLISTMTFLNTNRIVHADIKPGNIIYDNGLKIIDFGLARLSFPFRNASGETNEYFKGIAYTKGYVDPEYDDGEYNPIQSEMYAIGRTLYYLAWIKFGSDPETIASIMSDNWYLNTRDNQVNTVLAICSSYPVAKRRPIQYLNSIYGLPVVGSLIATPVLPVDKNCGMIVLTIQEWIFEVCRRLDFRIKTTFLTLHLIRRSLPVVIPDYPKNNKNIQLLSVVCCYLASNFYEPYPTSPIDMLYLCEDQYTTIQFDQMVIDVVKGLSGIILTPTYWDYAQYFEDLPNLLLDTISCDYNPEKIRQLSSKGTSKDRLTKELYPLVKDKLEGERSTLSERLLRAPPIERVGNIRICPTNELTTTDRPEYYVSRMIDLIPQLKDLATEEYILRLIFHHTSWLSQLPLEDAIGLYLELEKIPKGREMLRRIVKFDISRPIPFQALGLHPFQVSRAEIDLAM